MTGTIHVLDSLPLPHDQDFYDEEAADQRKDLLSDRDHDADREHHDSGSDDAGHSHDVTAGVGEVVATGGGHQTLSVLRFLEPTTEIHAGQTVEWTNTDPVTPHTITFGKDPANLIAPSSNVTLDADGARHVVLASTSDTAHSGFIVAARQERIGLPQSPLPPTPQGTVTRFRVTFAQPGVYNYICALHDNLGMKGKIIVLP